MNGLLFFLSDSEIPLFNEAVNDLNDHNILSSDTFSGIQFFSLKIFGNSFSKGLRVRKLSFSFHGGPLFPYFRAKV
jgi:hypothetical protein